MPFKDWFNSSASRSRERLEAEDLITLERYEEAEERLRETLRANPEDRRAQQRLADLYLRMGQTTRGAELLVTVADAFARDGFYDRAIALLAQVRRLNPAEASVAHRLQRLERTRRMEGLRSMVTGALSQAADRGGLRISPLELDGIWRNLAESALFESLEGAQLRRLMMAGEVLRCPEGRLLARRGEELRRLYLIVDGAVSAEITRRNGERTRLRSFAPGDVIGDAALLQRRPWPADYRGTEPSLVLALEAEGLEEALQGNPDPRRLLEALRSQRNDGTVAAAVARLRGGAG